MHPHGDRELNDETATIATRRPDEGSALILVLVLMIVGALIVLPLMDYAMSVGRDNTVLSIKTARTEAVKAGLRIALAEPTTALRDVRAGRRHGRHPRSRRAGSTCRCDQVLLHRQRVVARLRPRSGYGLAAVQKGQSVPAGMISSGYVSPDPSSTSAWIADTVVDSP